ncbi:sigma-54-dependent Fis family transcriptional regulator [bacterium]|nr:MAG: sigma-54-dependent Fis family transcriptional regulator [bacterium]
MDPIRIAIIDDERSIRNGCKLILSERGYDISLFETGAAGLKALSDKNYHLVLLDLKLPDIDGMEILSRMRRIKPGLHFIVMTGYSTVQVAIEAMKNGAFDYLPKPFSEDELLLSIDQAIDKIKLIEENQYLKKELISRFRSHEIVGENQKMLEVFAKAKKVAPTDSTVLFIGESGTGKELFASFIHTNSDRATKQFFAVDCSTFSPSLLESELFGHVKGAFTGAVMDKPGIFEIAEGGTLFLDDIANLSLETQTKLLRVLEMREFKPVGGTRVKTANIRVVAATNKELKTMVEEGTFREDLYYRLNVFPIYLPPLRERRDDIPRLAYTFLRLFCRKTGKRINGFTENALSVLVGRDWPGNVRELKNVIERLFILAEGEMIDSAVLAAHLHPHQSILTNPLVPETLEELKEAKKRILEQTFAQVERSFLLNALRLCEGNVTRASERTGMKRPNFHALMKKHSIRYTRSLS